MAIRYFATNRDLTNLGRAVTDYKARIDHSDHIDAIEIVEKIASVLEI